MPQLAANVLKSSSPIVPLPLKSPSPHPPGCPHFAANSLIEDALRELGRDDILVVVGGVIPPEDYDALRDAGAVAIFGPGTVIADAAIELLERLDTQLEGA